MKVMFDNFNGVFVVNSFDDFSDYVTPEVLPPAEFYRELSDGIVTDNEIIAADLDPATAEKIHAEYGISGYKNPAAVALGKMKSPAKATAARANGTKGGRPRKPAAIWWTAKNNSSYLDGCRPAASMRSAVIAARAYVAGELCGEGTITYYDSDPRGVTYPIRFDEKSIQTGHRWIICTDF